VAKDRKSELGKSFSELTGADKKQKKDQKDYDYKSIGIALNKDQIKRLDEIADQVGYNRSELVRFAVDELIKRFESGEIKTATETKTVTVLKSD
jgi:hypothetical protein